MSPHDRIRLQHMVDAIAAAGRFATGRQRSDRDTDEMLQFALVRAVEIVGEAAARVSEAARAQVPLPWVAVVWACATGWFTPISMSIVTSCGQPSNARFLNCTGSSAPPWQSPQAIESGPSTLR